MFKETDDHAIDSCHILINSILNTTLLTTTKTALSSYSIWIMFKQELFIVNS